MYCKYITILWKNMMVQWSDVIHLRKNVITDYIIHVHDNLVFCLGCQIIPDYVLLCCLLQVTLYIYTLRLRQNDRHFPEDTFKCIFLNENIWSLIEISPRFVPKGPINNIPTWGQIMLWRWPGNKPLSEPIVVRLLMRICVTRPQWVNKKQHNVMIIIVHDMSLNVKLR